MNATKFLKCILQLALESFSATSFMAWHTPVRNTKEYVGAMKAARKLAADITETINTQRKKSGTNPNKEVKVFAYT